MEITPLEGMDCTINIGSDRYAAKVVKVLSPKRIEITQNRFSDPGKGEVWSKRNDGRWRPAGSARRDGFSLTLGEAVDYRDPSY